MLANWLVGDAFKMVFFFAKGADQVPWAFKLCGIFQACCDCLLGVQFALWGDGERRFDGRVVAANGGVGGFVARFGQGRIGEQWDKGLELVGLDKSG